VTSEEKSTSSAKYTVTSGGLNSPDCASDLNTTAGSRSPILAPSILTIEATSAAKIYLELYFNSIFQNVDPRVNRQLELEQHMYAFQLSPEAQAETRKNWLLQENGYLRECRNLKTKMRSTRVKGMTSIAGYETIKILGRGSFGVVRLVREKDDTKSDGEVGRTSRPERSLSNPRPRSIGALRSAADGVKNGGRKVMAGEKEVYAMKVIRKREMISNSQEGHIRAERDFLVASERSQWVVPLISSFQDKANLYLVMDYMVGGDFLGLLIRKDILREEWTRFYVAEMILCIEEAHRLCWIHRDIKPDNFLISASGHLKISDFGLAFNGHWSHDQVYYHYQRYSLLERLGVTIKGDNEDQSQMVENEDNSPDPRLHGLEDPSRYSPPSTDLLEWRNGKERRRFAKSVVGTSQYMAPEVIRGEMYDGRCDWWSLGVIIYEVSGESAQQRVAY
jgi:serine/threonine protein kinase